MESAGLAAISNNCPGGASTLAADQFAPLSLVSPQNWRVCCAISGAASISAPSVGSDRHLPTDEHKAGGRRPSTVAADGRHWPDETSVIDLRPLKRPLIVRISVPSVGYCIRREQAEEQIVCSGQAGRIPM